MKIQKQATMSPLDVIVLLKIAIQPDQKCSQLALAKELFISQSEVSKSLQRSRYAGLVVGDYQVMRESLLDFLQFGIKYVYPQRPGPIVRGIPTAHSMYPLRNELEIAEEYVWPSPFGNMRGQAIVPLFPSVVDAANEDEDLHQVLALVDAIRVGRSRESNLAMQFLKNILRNEEHPNQPEGHY